MKFKKYVLSPISSVSLKKGGGASPPPLLGTIYDLTQSTTASTVFTGSLMCSPASVVENSKTSQAITGL